MSRDKSKQRIHLRSAFLGGLVAAMIVSALPAVAAQVGDALGLGESNRVNAQTILRGRAISNLTIISDARGDTNGTALDLRVRAGNPPLKVNSSDRVEGLNADLLDGLQATDLAVKRWAVVDGEGNLVRGERVVSASRFGEGTYTVRFDRDVSACGFSVTPLAQNGAFPIRSSTSSTGGFLADDTVGVGIISSSGAFLDGSFSLFVMC